MHAAAAYLCVLSIGHFAYSPFKWNIQEYSNLPGFICTFKTSSVTFETHLLTNSISVFLPIQSALALGDGPIGDITTPSTPLSTFKAPPVPSFIPSVPPDEPIEAFFQSFRDLPYAHVRWCPDLMRVKYKLPPPPGITADNGFHSGGFGPTDEQIKFSVVRLSLEWKWSRLDRAIVTRKSPEEHVNHATEPRLLIDPALWYFDLDSCVLPLDCAQFRNWKEGVQCFTLPEFPIDKRSLLEFLVEYREPEPIRIRGFRDLDWGLYR